MEDISWDTCRIITQNPVTARATGPDEKGMYGWVIFLSKLKPSMLLCQSIFEEKYKDSSLALKSADAIIKKIREYVSAATAGMEELGEFLFDEDDADGIYCNNIQREECFTSEIAKLGPDEYGGGIGNIDYFDGYIEQRIIETGGRLLFEYVFRCYLGHGDACVGEYKGCECPGELVGRCICYVDEGGYSILSLKLTPGGALSGLTDDLAEKEMVDEC